MLHHPILRGVWFALFILLYMFPFPHLQAKQTPLAPCTYLVKQKANTLNKRISDLEAAFHQYRWTERKVRRLYYRSLWESRNLQNYPLSKIHRKKGEAAEKELLAVLDRYEKEAGDSANAVELALDEIEGWGEQWKSCCPDKKFHDCADVYHDGFVAVVREMRKRFARIFERERDHRKDVKRSASSKDGLYLEESLESSDAHYDQYERYEQEREPATFEEDGSIMDDLLNLHLIADKTTQVLQCCNHCSES